MKNRIAALMATIVLAAVGAALVTWPLARQMDSATVGSGEVLLTAWQLNWFQHALLTKPLAWVDANIFFPYEGAAAFNDLLLTHAIVTLPAAWSESPVLALNLALLGGIVLCGLCAHLLILELVDEPWAATLGATLFALTPFRFLHLGHVSIAAAWTVPLFFWALLRHLRQPSWSRAAIASASGLAVGLSSLYHAAYVAPIVPLVVVFGARRGPGGRRVWWPLLATSGPGLVVFAALLMPYATALRAYGAAAAPHDLLRYGADLSSMGQRPDFLGGNSQSSGINPEAQLYPGTALALFAAAGVVVAAGSSRATRGLARGVAVVGAGVAAVCALGALLPLSGAIKEAWVLAVVTLVWAVPALLACWAVADASPSESMGSASAIRLGIAGAALAFAFALGPQARYRGETLGAAPYWLLAQLSSAFEGTRVPARFGGIVMLFLAVSAAGALAGLAGGRGSRRRIVAAGAGALGLVGCFVELPAPPLPQGRELVPLPRLREPAYRWIREQPGPLGILELPDWPSEGGFNYEYRGWRALRYMLASKQHGQHLVNGTGRIEPLFWSRFRTLEPWSDDFFGFITSYFPVDYVLVHEAGIPPADRDRVRARLSSGVDGWQQVFGWSGVKVYTIDRSSDHGDLVDRYYLRRHLAPQADVAFAARSAPHDPEEREEVGSQSVTLDVLVDGKLVRSFELGAEWRQFRLSVPVDAVGEDRLDGWPRSGVLVRWQAHDDAKGSFEIARLSVQKSGQPPR